MPTAPEHDLDQEPEYRCTHCTRLLYRDELERYVCRVCERRTASQLRVLPAMYEQLQLRLPPGRSAARKGAPPREGSAPLPVSMGALDMLGPGGMVTLLQDVEDSWRRALGRTMIKQGATDSIAGLRGVITFLDINLVTACERHETVGDDLDTISKVYWRSAQIVDGIQPMRIAVHCRYLILDDAGQPVRECEAPMAVDLNRPVAKCPECGTRWGQQEWMALFEATRLEVA